MDHIELTTEPEEISEYVMRGVETLYPESFDLDEDEGHAGPEAQVPASRATTGAKASRASPPTVT